MKNQVTEQKMSIAPVVTPNPAPVLSIPKKSNGLVWVLFFLVFLLSVVVAFFVYQNLQLRQQLTVQLTPTPVSSPVPTIDPTASWTSYAIPEYGVSFKLPKNYGPLDYPDGNVTKGEKGFQYCIEYIPVGGTSWHLVKEALAGGGGCLPSLGISFGSTSLDYEAGRGGTFGDLQGYRAGGGKYFAKMNLGREVELPANLVKETQSLNGVSILVIKGKNDGPENFPVTGTPGLGHVGALINLPTGKYKYPGIAIDTNLSKGMNEETFMQVLSTIKFTN